MPSIENQTLSKLYYSIGEVASMLQVNASLLRFWEKEFNLTVSKKNKKGNRLFSVKEIEQIQRIYQFVKVEGYTLDGAKKALKQKSSSPLSEPFQIVQKEAAPANQNFAEIIGKLEGIKTKLLHLSLHSETAQKTAIEPIQEITPVLQEVATASLEKEQLPTLEKEPTPTTITPPKKRSVEKSKPASDMPTLFDF
jgi:DNA-binding transcriptional MerR regulator